MRPNMSEQKGRFKGLYRSLLERRQRGAARLDYAGSQLTPSLRYFFQGSSSGEEASRSAHLLEPDVEPANALGLQWRHKAPIAAVDELVSRFGQPNVQGSFIAIWRAVQGFAEVAVRDELVPHVSPSPHVDFLYTTIALDVLPDRRHEVLNLSSSITYDPLKGWLCVRCHSLPANCAILLMAKLLAIGAVTYEQAKRDLPETINEVGRDEKLFREIQRSLLMR